MPCSTAFKRLCLVGSPSRGRLGYIFFAFFRFFRLSLVRLPPKRISPKKADLVHPDYP